MLSACTESHVAVGSDAGCARGGECVGEDATIPGNDGDATVPPVVYGGASNACEGSVTFGDSSLESAVRLALGIGEARPIDGIEMLALTSLSVPAEKGPVGSLVGLECAKNLSSLSMVGHEIVSLEPLRGLVALRYINLGDNQIVDVSPLAALRHVSVLDVSGNQISDLGSLQDPSWIEPGPCVTVLSFHGNPLNGSSLNKTIPALCDYADTVSSAEVWIEWTGGNCHNDVICDFL